MFDISFDYFLHKTYIPLTATSDSLQKTPQHCYVCHFFIASISYLACVQPDTVGGMPQSTIKVGVSEDAQVVFTTSPAEFYVQLQSSYDLLTQLMERIATACESGW